MSSSKDLFPGKRRSHSSTSLCNLDATGSQPPKKGTTKKDALTVEETQNLLLSNFGDEDTGSDSDLFSSPQHNHKMIGNKQPEEAATLFKKRPNLRSHSESSSRPEDAADADLIFNGITKNDVIAFIDESPH